MKKNIALLIAFAFSLSSASAQAIHNLVDNGKISLRGLSVVDDRVVWVSGSSGTVGRSLDGGKSWEWTIVKGFEKRDFRDIEAFDGNRAIVIAVAEPANILKTIDGGKSWQTVFSDSAKGMFLDAIDFNSENKEGIVVGDPLDGMIYMATTQNGGNNWIPVPIASRLKVNEGEAMFAASGSNVKLISHGGPSKMDIVLVTGGRKSRLFYNHYAIDLPIVQGKESTGANGIDVWESRKGIIVGGDFAADSITEGNCVLFELNGKINLTLPQAGPHGYRSGVAWLDSNRAISCGISGVDITNDGGKTWKLVSTEGYHVCKKAKAGSSVFLAGSHGRVSRLDW
jgi:photosystem II stability/assembly factor-like uncharacterized protein